MDRTERFYRIDQLLTDRRVASFAAMQAALEVSRATLKRDLQYLRDRLNAPIVYDRDAGGYRYDGTGAGAKFELPGLWFNASEIYALLTMQNLLAEVQPGLLGPHIAPLQARLKNLLGSRDDAPEEVARRIRILHAARRRPNAAHFEPIAAALLKRKRLVIRHYNRGRDEETMREVSPQRLVYYRDNWYLDAWCHLRDGIRSFAVDAIRGAEMLEKWAKLRFAPEAARWVASEQWHPQQKATTLADGGHLLELPYANPTELVMDILRHGAQVQVLAPESLRQRVRDELEKARQLYTT
jgi:predicted DNA-binding transcriptional regulator YafY